MGRVLEDGGGSSVDSAVVNGLQRGPSDLLSSLRRYRCLVLIRVSVGPELQLF